MAYVAAVVGTFAGAEIIRTCDMLASAPETEIGGRGIWDAISLAGMFGVILSIALAALAWVLPGLCPGRCPG